MANSIKFMNEGFSKYENIKPSFEDCLYEAMKSLTERRQEWSDEDKKDNELLWSIFDKRQERSNAKLTPDEKSVLKKYDIEDPFGVASSSRYGDKRVVAKTSPVTNLFDKDVQSIGNYTTYNDKVNLADKARKQKSRYLAKKDVDKYTKDSTNKVNSMKNELRSRKYYNNELNDIDSRYNKRIKDLEAERDSKKDRYAGYVTDSQSRINKLLKRESLKEANYSNKYGGSKEDYISDIEDIDKVLRDISSNIATLGAEEIIQDFIEQLESLKNSALNESLNKRTSLKK